MTGILAVLIYLFPGAVLWALLYAKGNMRSVFIQRRTSTRDQVLSHAMFIVFWWWFIGKFVVKWLIWRMRRVAR